MKTLLFIVSLVVPPVTAVAATPDGTEADERRIMDILVRTYGATDWSAVDGDMTAHPSGTNNPERDGHTPLVGKWVPQPL